MPLDKNGLLAEGRLVPEHFVCFNQVQVILYSEVQIVFHFFGVDNWLPSQTRNVFLLFSVYRRHYFSVYRRHSSKKALICARFAIRAPKAPTLWCRVLAATIYSWLLNWCLPLVISGICIYFKLEQHSTMNIFVSNYATHPTSFNLSGHFSF